MKSFFSWFFGNWKTDSDWPAFTYGVLGLFAVCELVYQFINNLFPVVPWLFLGVLAFYIFILCPIGYFTRHKP